MKCNIEINLLIHKFAIHKYAIIYQYILCIIYINISYTNLPSSPHYRDRYTGLTQRNDLILKDNIDLLDPPNIINVLFKGMLMSIESTINVNIGYFQTLISLFLITVF